MIQTPTDTSGLTKQALRKLMFSSLTYLLLGLGFLPSQFSYVVMLTFLELGIVFVKVKLNWFILL